MMAQAAVDLGAVVRRTRKSEVVGNRRESGREGGNPEHQHTAAIETSPAKRVSSIPFIYA